MRKPVFGVSDQVRHKPECTINEDGEMLEISNLGIEVEGLCYPCSENKGADQLRGNCEADLCLCFCICKKKRFFQDAVQLSAHTIDEDSTSNNQLRELQQKHLH